MEALKKWLKRIFWVLLAGAAVWLLMRAFEPEPVLVDAAVIERGELVMSVEDDGRTRIRERYTISAPMDGRLLRPPLKLGDRVEAQETIVANFEPQAPQLLDVRSKAEAREKVRRAEAALNEAKALQGKAKADLAFAKPIWRGSEPFTNAERSPMRSSIAPSAASAWPKKMSGPMSSPSRSQSTSSTSPRPGCSKTRGKTARRCGASASPLRSTDRSFASSKRARAASSPGRPSSRSETRNGWRSSRSSSRKMPSR